MRTLVIDRAVWLRGEGADDSRLLRSDDGKRCCVGIYLSALGVRDSQLNEVPTAQSAHHDFDLPEEARWLLSKQNECEPSGKASRLYAINDSKRVTAKERERRIAEIFAEQSCKVRFTGRSK